MGRREDRGNRIGTILVLLGFASILMVTFGTGFYAGRLSGPRPSAESAVSREARRGLGGGRLPDVASAADMPDLTFYQELTAPLAAPPPPPKPRRRPPPVAVPAAETAASPPAPSIAPPSLPERRSRSGETVPGAPASPGVRYTVQVGAYRAREPAEALRSSLAAAGHPAQVVEIDAPGGVRYRVRVGSFATREDAREAAGKLTSAGVLSAFVTTRTPR